MQPENISPWKPRRIALMLIKWTSPPRLLYLIEDNNAAALLEGSGRQENTAQNRGWIINKERPANEKLGQKIARQPRPSSSPKFSRQLHPGVHNAGKLLESAFKISWNFAIFCFCHSLHPNIYKCVYSNISRKYSRVWQITSGGSTHDPGTR